MPKLPTESRASEAEVIGLYFEAIFSGLQLPVTDYKCDTCTRNASSFSLAGANASLAQPT